MKDVIGFDTESYYDDEVSVRPLGAWMYSRHPRCDVYLISVSDDTGSWAGHPRDFNFDSLKGKTLVSHNAAFDQEMYFASVEKGLWPKIDFKEWHCTANLSAFLCNRRSLDDAAEFLFDLKLSKEMRDYMKGKSWEDAVRDGKADQLLQYARDDAAVCRRIWVEHAHKWPERERRLSQLTIEQGRRGVHIHQERLKTGMERLQRVILASTDKLPWVAAGRPPASPRGIAEACRASDIPPPPVKAHDADGAEEWEEKYSPVCPWVKALKDLRKAKRALAIYQKIKLRLRPDGTMGFSLRYQGAHTGRWAGDSGVNMQNFNREPLFVANDTLLDSRSEIEARLPAFYENPDDPAIGAVDLRSLFLPPPGYKMSMVDLSQIEPRVLNWLAGNFELLKRIASGFPIYEAHARDSMGWTGGDLKKENPKLYSLAKARTLGLGFSCSWRKFILVAKILAKLDITQDDEKAALEASTDGKIHREWEGKPCEPFVFTLNRFGRPERTPVYGANSRAIVRDFREKNPRITALWRTLQQALEDAVGGDLKIDLPGGDFIVYRNVRAERRTKKNIDTGLPEQRIVYTAEADGRRKEFYGGLICENITQKVARNVFAEGMLRTLDAGFWPIWSVHDEEIVAVKTAEEGETVRKIMAQAPDWLPRCPVEAELTLADCYKK